MGQDRRDSVSEVVPVGQYRMKSRDTIANTAASWSMVPCDCIHGEYLTDNLRPSDHTALKRTIAASLLCLYPESLSCKQPLTPIKNLNQNVIHAAARGPLWNCQSSYKRTLCLCRDVTDFLAARQLVSRRPFRGRRNGRRHASPVQRPKWRVHSRQRYSTRHGRFLSPSDARYACCWNLQSSCANFDVLDETLSCTRTTMQVHLEPHRHQYRLLPLESTLSCYGYLSLRPTTW